MKSYGDILEFTEDRNADLMRAYRYQIRKARHIHAGKVAKALVNMPASRFWVSEKRARNVVGALIEGKDLPENMRPSKCEMFSEIYRRVLELRKARPEAPVLDLIREVIYSPAPKFYMLPRSAMHIIYKIKKGHHNDSLKNRYTFSR